MAGGGSLFFDPEESQSVAEFLGSFLSGLLGPFGPGALGFLGAS